MKTKVKVLQVMGSLGLGGAESRMMDVYRHINRNEYQFDFLSMANVNEHFDPEIKSLGGQVYRISAPRFTHLLEHVRELRKVIRMSGCTVVHAHTSFHCGLVMLAGKMEHVPVRISHARTTGSKRNSRIKKVALFIGQKLISKFSTHRFAISRDAGKFLFGNSCFEVLPNAIDVGLYQKETQADANMIRKELMLPERATIIGQIGRFNGMKNHEFSVNWFNSYVREYPDTYLVFVGDGSLRNEIEAQVKELGLSGKVVFLGRRNDVPRIIHAFDVILFPSKFEGLGGVSLEAQAAGIPIIQSENLPDETDMGLGMIRRCSLNAPLSEWTSEVNLCLKMQRVDYDTINQAFENKKYSLESEIKRLEEVYNS